MFEPVGVRGFLSIFQKPLQPDLGYNLLASFMIEKIGLGQFSEVYLLEYTPVALKKVQIFDLMDAKARQDCIKEIDLLKRLIHPNAMKYHTSFIEDRKLIPERTQLMHRYNVVIHTCLKLHQQIWVNKLA
uniref:NIMA related kinase 7 n=1 Tax=Nothobranchius furzeri TaxID=105023 RepID=A0A8C6VRD3_NOTFU